MESTCTCRFEQIQSDTLLKFFSMLNMFYFLPHRGKRAKLARDFFNKILDMDYGNVLVTIQSSIWDFPFEGSNEEIIEKINAVYSVDISDIVTGNLDAIFRRIEKKGNFFNRTRYVY